MDPLLPDASDPRLQNQLRFLLKADQLKTVERRTFLVDGSRHENSAEHSWHFALALLLFDEYALGPIDRLRALQMAIIHDLVEIFAGDTYAYDEKAQQHRAAREQDAANRLFSILPSDQATEFHAIWREFEEKNTPTARFASALDRLAPVLQNYVTNGRAWREQNVSVEQVEEVVGSEMSAAPELAHYLRVLLQAAGEKGLLSTRANAL